ncbi:ABC transporter substrate-binding protein [Nonomuraea sp. NPDC059023]|uniref:ABC transporter substrate-binding protein n=1 Tax=unclassified Nonomuraea TaxID=2593643 RepID=UPI0036837636
MTAGPRPLRIGACLSLSGKHARFGRQAAAGLQVWRDADQAAELMIEDDQSEPDVLEAGLRRLADFSDIILGPYSTHLMRRAGRVIASLDRLLWNHGGSGDDVEAAHPGHVISVLTPTSLYAEPFIRRVLRSERSGRLWIAHGKGRFGQQVADGAEKVARSMKIPTVRLGPDEALPSPREAWNFFCAGSFEEDVERVRLVRELPRPPQSICAVAAGVQEFGEALDHPQGVYGVGQWIPGSGGEAHLGLSEVEFVARYKDRTGDAPDYPAVQAAATATLAAHCTRQVGTTERQALWSTALALETTTVFGAFKVDPSGVQVGHQGALMRWSSTGLTAAT